MSGYHYQISEASRLLAVEAHVLRYWEEELGMIIPRNEMGHRYYTEDHLRIFSQIKDMKERGYQLRAIRAILSGEENPENTFNHFPSEGNGGCQVTEIPIKKEPLTNGKQEIGADASDMAIKAVHASLSGMASASEVDESYSEGRKTEGYGGNAVIAEQKGERPEYSKENYFVEHPVHTENTAEVETSPDEKMRRFQVVMTHIVAQAMLCNNAGLAMEISQKVEGRLLPEIEALMKISENRQEERFRKLDESMRMIQQNNRARYEAAASKSPFWFGRKKKKRNMRRI